MNERLLVARVTVAAFMMGVPVPPPVDFVRRAVLYAALVRGYHV